MYNRQSLIMSGRCYILATSKVSILLQIILMMNGTKSVLPDNNVTNFSKLFVSGTYLKLNALSSDSKFVLNLS